MPENGWYGGNPFHGGPSIATLGELLARGGKPGEQFGAYMPRNINATVADEGMLTGLAEVDAAARVARLAVHGNFFEQDTGAVSGDNASIALVTTDLWRPDANPVMILKFSLPDITNIRFFAGWTQADANGVLGGDDHGSADHCALSFSTGRPDTTFQLSTEDTADNQDDALVTVTTGVWTLVMDFPTDISARLTLFDANGALAGSVTSATQVPPAAADYGWVIGVETLENLLKQIRHFGCWMSQGTPR